MSMAIYKIFIDQADEENITDGQQSWSDMEFYTVIIQAKCKSYICKIIRTILLMYI